MYKVDDECRKNVWKIFGKNEEQVKEDVEEIRKWMGTQTHFPEKLDDAMITNFLQLNKFRIEKTKEKISNYYTIRTKIPEIFSENHPKLPELQQLLEIYCQFTHPELVENLHRVLFIRKKEKEHSVYSPYDLLKVYINIFEIRLREDCMFNDIVIMDMANMTLRDVLKFNPRVAYNFISFCQKVFSFRLKSIIFLNSPLYISIWVQIFKLLLPKKIFERVEIYRDAEVMKQVFSEEQLLKEYGGGGPTMEELNDMMKEKLNENEDVFDKLDGLNQQMRNKKKTNAVK